MADQWYYAVNDDRRGPVTRDALARLVRDGVIGGEARVWSEGLPGWAPAASVPGLLSASAAPLPPLPQAAAAASTVPGRGVLGGIGARISAASDLPTISSMPVGQILVGGLQKQTRSEDMVVVGWYVVLAILKQALAEVEQARLAAAPA